jgi:hypothetical protein
MAAPRKLLGTVACFNPNCGVDVPVKQSDGGAVAASCPYCDLQAYGKDGTEAKRDILKLMRPTPGQAPAPTPAPAAAPVASAPAPAPKPAPAPAKAKTTIFG